MPALGIKRGIGLAIITLRLSVFGRNVFDAVGVSGNLIQAVRKPHSPG
jgi:hypothetical protein